jgi:hypothetical protein
MRKTVSTALNEFSQQAVELARRATQAAAAAPNEASLRHELEGALENCCTALGMVWNPFVFEVYVRSGDGKRRFVDVAHGGVLIEYEPPRSFGGSEGAALRHAKDQVEEYALFLHGEEGRPLDRYTLIAWDGAHVCFGRYVDGAPTWDALLPFTAPAGEQLLRTLVEDGAPLVSPRLISTLVGPESELGAQIIPELFIAIRTAAEAGGVRTNSTHLIFTEWKRLFGQVVGSQSDPLRKLLEDQSRAHGQPYSRHVAEYLFAMNTYIALVAKLVAALSLPNPSQNVADSRVPVADRIDALESGRLFADAGVLNMLAGDFFSWYRYDPSWGELAAKVEKLVTYLGTANFDVTKKTPESTRDLFKGLYQSFVPRALRHAMGEFYTPDWLAGHLLDELEWSPESPLLDPTCGSGTFLLEALRRRLCSDAFSARRTAKELVDGLYGIDLNPLAVLAARASFTVFLSPHLNPEQPIRLPFFLADALNPTRLEGDIYVHELQTELGRKSFRVPQELVCRDDFFDIFNRLRELIDANFDEHRILVQLTGEFGLTGFNAPEEEAWKETIRSLVSMHKRRWNGIWCPILADRFAAGAIPPVDHVCGNPPWVKWSHLPPDYAAFIKDRCMAMGVFSEDRWVGGIESDISTVITFAVIDQWLAPGGRLAFLITGPVFTNESSQGFRRFELQHRDVCFKLLKVEDFSGIRPFENVSNHAVLFLLERDSKTEYPVPYRLWQGTRGKNRRDFSTPDEFRRNTTALDLLAQPVPGTDAGPWMKGTADDHTLWSKLFNAKAPVYAARKGVTTDRNGIFFLRVRGRSRDGKICDVENDPTLGKTQAIPTVRAQIECEHLFPLLRGRGVIAFSAVPDPEYRILLPQRGMHGDPDLALSARKTSRFLSRFRSELEGRSSYKRFQKNKPYWSLWSTGNYTFSPYKVVWREMGGGRFSAAYIGTHHDRVLGEKLVIPDHKLYFVPVGEVAEAAYLTGLLNAPIISRAVSAYAAQLSLGASVVEYLDLPLFHAENPNHAEISQLAQEITRRGGKPTAEEWARLDSLAYVAFSIEDAYAPRILEYYIDAV